MKQKAIETPRLLQILFIGGLALAYVSQLFFSLRIYFMGLDTNVNNGFTMLNLVNFLFAFIPLVVWIAVHLSRRDRRLSVKSVFESLLLTFAAMLVMISLSNVQSIINFYPSGLTGMQNMWWFTLMNTALPLAIIVCGLIVSILHMRRKKQW